MSLSFSHSKVEDFCQRWQVTEFCLFGSALRDDFRPDSDVDVMVSFAADVDHDIFALSAMRRELEELFDRSVDLVERRQIEASPNYIRRQHILDSAKVIYGPGSGISA